MGIRKFKDKYPKIGDKVFIDDTAVIIGDVVLGDNVSVWPNAVIRGDVEAIRIGDETNVQDGAILHVSHASDFSVQGYPLNIGKGVTIGHGVVIHGCEIGNYSLIGIGAIIMDGSAIQNYVMLGAGSLVPPGKTLESGFLYVGAPAKKVRELNESERLFLEYSCRHYMQMKDIYLQQD